ncbi:MAG: xanthine dehydrogenase family protein molybdopterin-binding subunit [Chloroflexi bacterium]|nr:xanthine dehydrogenase family protein molybdopterin-binding subunit [Chloroflexota bacterium]
MATVMKTSRDVRGIGIRIPRPDAPEKVAGKTQYVADLQLPGMLHARLLRSPHAHARIKSIDTSKAKALPGVRAVLTASDIPELEHGAKTRGHAIMAIDRAVFAGQPVAAVAADELAIADEALDLIEVVYEVLPAAIDPIKSMRPDAPRVADEGTEADTSEALAHSGIAPTESEAAENAPNVAQKSNLGRGDVKRAFAESDYILEKTYHVPMVHQGYIEAHGAVADYNRATGTMTVWASTQGSFNTRSEIADVLKIPEASIKVVPLECGGGFGAKIRALTEPITVLLSRATGRPVKYMMTRREELEAGMPAPSVTIKLRTGVKKDGTPLALEGETIIEAGAYSGAVLTMSGVFLASVYQWPNFQVTGYEVLTHKPSIAAYRAPMAPQTAFVIDSHMDQIARHLGLDPAEYKIKHCQRGGDLMAHGQPWQVNGARECLEALEAHPYWQERDAWRESGQRDGVLRGTGIAMGGWVPGIQPTSASIRLNPDGTLTVITGSVDIAGTNLGLALIAAEAYGVDIERVKIVTGDTDTAPLTGISAGSKTTYTVGAAVIEAAHDARRQTLDIASSELEAAVEDLDIVNNEVVVQGVPGKSITLAAIGKKGNTFQSRVPPVYGTSSMGFAVQAPAFAAQLARIEVDPDTGQITLTDFICAQDVGKLLNPLGAEGQIQGGSVQSLGFALTEGLMYNEQGRLMNPSLLDYRKLTAADVPNIETIIIEVPAPAGPFGARGVGEPPIVPALAAMANALEDASGLRLTTMPLTPERVALGLAAE